MSEFNKFLQSINRPKLPNAKEIQPDQFTRLENLEKKLGIERAQVETTEAVGEEDDGTISE